MRRFRMFVGVAMALGAVAVIGCSSGGDGGNEVRILEEQLAAEETARLAAEQQAAAEAAAKLAAAELAAEEAARLAAEQKAAAEEAARLAAEKEAADEAARLEREKAAAELKAVREELARVRAEAELAAVQEDDDDTVDDDPLLTASASTATQTDDTGTTTTGDTHAGLPGGTANPLLDGTAATGTTTPPAPTTPQPTPQQTTPTGPSAESVKRAAGIMAALGETDPALQTSAATSLATITVEDRAIKITSGDFKAASGLASLPGFTGKLLESKGALGDVTERWGVYTDIETTRGVLEQFHADKRVVDKPGQFTVDDALLDADYTPTGRPEQPLVTLPLPGPGSTAVGAERTITKEPGQTITGGRVRGVPGTFECTGTANCTMTFTLALKSGITTGTSHSHYELADDGLGATGAWIFKAGSQPKIAIIDEEYMQFSWWLKEPTSASGDYDFQLRWGVAAATAGDISGVTATYKGSATGYYVEETAGTIVSDGDTLAIVKSGVFTADATLRATAGAVTGAVTKFKEGGRLLGNWAVLLNDDDKTTLTISGTGSPVTTTVDAANHGPWAAAYVPSRVTTEAPVAAVGYFDAHIPNSLRLSGAFGAKRQVATQ